MMQSSWCIVRIFSRLLQVHVKTFLCPPPSNLFIQWSVHPSINQWADSGSRCTYVSSCLCWSIHYLPIYPFMYPFVNLDVYPFICPFLWPSQSHSHSITSQYTPNFHMFSMSLLHARTSPPSPLKCLHILTLLSCEILERLMLLKLFNKKKEKGISGIN